MLASPGLLGRDVDVVVAGLRALLEGGRMFEVDAGLAPLSWRHHLYTDDRSLRIGWYDHDEVFPVTPGCRRAVAEAREALQAAGHHLVSFTPPGVRRAWKLITACFTADQGRTTQGLLDNERLDQVISTNKQSLAAPRLIRAVNKHIVQRKSPLMADLLSSKFSLARITSVKLDEA